MKEILNQKLANPSQTPYSKGGDIFMAENGGGKDMPPNSQPTGPENTGQKERTGEVPQIPAEQVEEARKEWESRNNVRRAKGEEIPVEELRSQEMAWEQGAKPDLTQEAKDLLGTVDKGGVPTFVSSNFGRILRENGISEEDIQTKTPAELISILGRKSSVASGAGVPPGGNEPPRAPPVSEPEEQPEDNGGEGENVNPLENLIKGATNDQLKSILEKISSGVREVGSPQDLKDEFIAEQMAAIRKLIDEKQISGADEIIAGDIMSQLSQLRMSRLSSLDRMAAQDRDPELKAVAEEIIKVFSSDRVREELIKNNPNLNSLVELKSLVDKSIDPTRQDILILANTITDENGIVIQGKEKLTLSEESKKLLYEWLVEKIISIPDSTPDAHYNIGSFYITANLDSLLDTARRRFNDDNTSTYLNELKHYRQAMHELNLALRVGEQYKEFVLKELSSNGFDFVNNRLAGTGAIIRLYEKTYANKVREKRQWLTGQDVDEVDNEVRQIVGEQFNNGEITKGSRVLTEWEKGRALRLGRILFSGSQRKAIYSGFGDLPAGTASRIGSLPDEYVVRSIYDWKIFAPRFFGPEAAPRRFIQHVFKHARSLNEKAFDKGVLGVKPDTLIENSFGGYDMQSHGWRSELLFLGNQLFVAEDGTKRTLQQVLDSKINEYTKGKKDEHTKEEIDEGIWGYPSLSEKAKDGERSEKEKFSDDVRKVVLGQRIYLSSLARYGNFSTDLKADIWRKRAALMPSTVVTLLPDETLDTEQEKELWEQIRHRVYRAEERRIQGESLDERSFQKVEDEAGRFKKGKEAKTVMDKELRYEFVNNYCQDFSEAEREFLKKIIDKVYPSDEPGKKNLPGLAERLAETNMSFTLVIDDAPTIAWKKKGGQYGNAGFETADFIRLLASDQDNFSKGWQPIVALTESPQSANFEILEKAVDPIFNVIGREAAQKKIEPFIAATLEMYSTDITAEFIPGVMFTQRMLDKPTSEIERYFKKTYISWNAEKRKDFLVKLLQARVLGSERFNIMRKETKSTGTWVFLTLFKFWVELVGAEAAYQMFKGFLPEEVGKSL